MSSDGLRSALASLDRHWAERDRGWLGGLRAGLTLDKIDDAERAIRPMLFTEEHRVLYAWHDGDGERHAFGEDWPPFLPLMEAIEQWRFGVKELGWTPCWMPLLNMGLDYRVSLVDSLRHDESGVLDYYLQAEPTALVPSIEALVRWRLACLMTGAGRDESKALRHQFEAPILVRGEPISPRIRRSALTIGRLRGRRRRASMSPRRRRSGRRPASPSSDPARPRVVSSRDV